MKLTLHLYLTFIPTLVPLVHASPDFFKDLLLMGKTTLFFPKFAYSFHQTKSTNVSSLTKTVLRPQKLGKKQFTNVNNLTILPFCSTSPILNSVIKNPLVRSEVQNGHLKQRVQPQQSSRMTTQFKTDRFSCVVRWNWVKKTSFQIPNLCKLFRRFSYAVTWKRIEIQVYRYIKVVLRFEKGFSFQRKKFKESMHKLFLATWQCMREWSLTSNGEDW